MKFHHMVQSLDWRSSEQKWRLEVLVNGSETKIFWAGFVIMGTGYYDYNKVSPHSLLISPLPPYLSDTISLFLQGLQSPIPSIDKFTGQVVHPQFWPKDLDYQNKKVVIIGSGATAVTILPAMASSGAAHVTMLQRSPGYHVTLPSSQPLNQAIRKYFRPHWANQIIRMRFLLQSYAFFYYCRFFPKSAINLLRTGTRKELEGTNFTLEEHFTPSYRPWEQRMCISPDGDFFSALHSGKGDVVTGHIEGFEGRSILLKDGKRIDDVDIVITATGLKVQLCGNAKLSVDGEAASIGEKFVWRGAMLQDIPVS
jgi:cation diffusion facilitator CzcD-associated flavoprotein CzcO